MASYPATTPSPSLLSREDQLALWLEQKGKNKTVNSKSSRKSSTSWASTKSRTSLSSLTPNNGVSSSGVPRQPWSSVSQKSTPSLEREQHSTTPRIAIRSTQNRNSITTRQPPRTTTTTLTTTRRSSQNRLRPPPPPSLITLSDPFTNTPRTTTLSRRPLSAIRKETAQLTQRRRQRSTSMPNEKDENNSENAHPPYNQKERVLRNSTTQNKPSALGLARRATFDTTTNTPQRPPSPIPTTHDDPHSHGNTDDPLVGAWIDTESPMVPSPLSIHTTNSTKRSPLLNPPSPSSLAAASATATPVSKATSDKSAPETAARGSLSSPLEARSRPPDNDDKDKVSATTAVATTTRSPPTTTTHSRNSTQPSPRQAAAEASLAHVVVVKNVTSSSLSSTIHHDDDDKEDHHNNPSPSSLRDDDDFDWRHDDDSSKGETRRKTRRRRRRKESLVLLPLSTPTTRNSSEGDRLPEQDKDTTDKRVVQEEENIPPTHEPHKKDDDDAMGRVPAQVLRVNDKAVLECIPEKMSHDFITELQSQRDRLQLENKKLDTQIRNLRKGYEDRVTPFRDLFQEMQSLREANKRLHQAKEDSEASVQTLVQQLKHQMMTGLSAAVAKTQALEQELEEMRRHNQQLQAQLDQRPT